MAKAPESRNPLDDLMVFHGLARSLTSNLDLNSILRTILEYMERFVDGEFWALLILEPAKQELYYALAQGGRDAQLTDLRVKVGEGLAGWVAQHGETLIIPEAADDVRLSEAGGKQPFVVRSAIGLPIRGRKGTHGVLEILNQSLGDQGDYKITFLHILADYAAIAIENAQDVARAQELTITDDATGLYNVRHLYSVFDRELAIARKEHRPLSLVFLDLDHFKEINDAHGHLVGSELLRLVGGRLRDICADSDLCFRYGGDEFVILMPHTSKEEALQRSCALHGCLSESVFRVGPRLDLTIGSSIGLASFPVDGRTIHSILGCADKRMYMAKSNGRGRVQA